MGPLLKFPFRNPLFIGYQMRTYFKRMTVLLQGRNGLQPSLYVAVSLYILSVDPMFPLGCGLARVGIAIAFQVIINKYDTITHTVEGT